MNVLHINELPKLHKTIRRSFTPTLIGALFISGWGYGIFWLSQNKIPTFVLVINYLFYPLFIFILYRDIKSFFNKEKFLLGLYQNSLLMPLNHPIKNPKDNNKLYLQLFGDDFSIVEIEKKAVKETKYEDSRQSNTKSTIYLKFTSNCELDLLRKKLVQVKDQGFQGYPVKIVDNNIQYEISGNRLKLSKIRMLLQRRFPLQYSRN